MKKKTLLVVFLVSLVLAGICFYAATAYVDALVKETKFAPVVKVAKGRQIEPFEPITREDLVVELEEADEIDQDAARTVEEVLGKRSIQTIFEGEQLRRVKLEDGLLLPDQGKARYEFPLTSMMPVTELRKGDRVKVWVRYKPSAELQTMPPSVYFKKSNPAADLLFETQLATVKDSNGIEIYTMQPQMFPQADQVGQALFHASEAKKYADSERRFRDYRAQPSAVPAYVGMNLTDQQYRTLIEAMQYGTIQIGHVMVGKEGERY